MVRVLRPVARQVHVQDRRIELVTGGVVEFWSLDTPDVARGRKFRRVIIDEAAMIPKLEEAWQGVIRPTLADLEGDAWFLSTPRGFDYFHTLYQRGRSDEFPDWASWQMPTTANPFIPPGEIEQARQETPETVFRQEYLALFEEDDATIFSPRWWADPDHRYDPEDGGLRNRVYARVLSWDTALKEKATAAYSAVVVGELLPYPDYRLLIREVWRDRLAFPSLVDESTRWARRYDRDAKLHAVLIEDKASGISLTQTLQAAFGKNADLVVPFMPSGDKPTRARLASVDCRNGSVLLPTHAPWLREFEAELFAAPFGAYMDQVDAFVQLVLYWQHYLREGHRRRGGLLAQEEPVAA
jgi:predicted phage terminase large subunit-like protein